MGRTLSDFFGLFFAIAVKITLTLFTLTYLLIYLLGCASADPIRGPASYNRSDYNSNAHPASYLVDVFQVNRPLPEHKPSNNAEFYFKRCDQNGERWPYSRTSYDCDYP